MYRLDKHSLPSLMLITGPSGAGKTRWCRSLQALAVANGMSVAGLLSPPVMNGGEKIGIDLEDLQSGERRRLATRTQLIIDGEQTLPRGALTTGDWSFDPQVLHWGNAILKSLGRPASCPDLLIVDELGPLEFRHSQGLLAALKLIDDWRCRLVCVTVRPWLVGAARMRWPWSQILVVGEEQGEMRHGGIPGH